MSVEPRFTGGRGEEADRLQFLEQRDGISGARRFAAQTMKLYKEAIQKRKGTADRAKRRLFVAAFLAFKNYLKFTGLPA